MGRSALDILPLELWAHILSPAFLALPSLLAVSGVSSELNAIVYTVLLDGTPRLPDSLFAAGHDIYITRESLRMVAGDPRELATERLVYFFERGEASPATLEWRLDACQAVLGRAIFARELRVDLGCDVFKVAQERTSIFDSLTRLLGTLPAKILRISVDVGPVFVIHADSNGDASGFMASLAELQSWTLHRPAEQFGRPASWMERRRSPGTQIGADQNSGRPATGTIMTLARTYTGGLTVVPRLIALRSLAVSLQAVDSGANADYGRYMALIVLDPDKIVRLHIAPPAVTRIRDRNGSGKVSAARIASSVIRAVNLPILKELTLDVGKDKGKDGPQADFVHAALRKFQGAHPRVEIRLNG